MAVLLGLLSGGVQERRGRWLVVICTALLSLWMGSQIVYYHLFKTFLTIFSITKMAMVAGSLRRYGGGPDPDELVSHFDDGGACGAVPGVPGPDRER